MRKLLLVMLSVLMVSCLALCVAACEEIPQDFLGGDSETTISSTEQADTSSTEPAEHVHTLPATYETDGTYHWRVCEECGEIVGKAEHQTGNASSTEALVDGTTCTYRTTYSAACKLCGEKVVLEETTLEKHDYELSSTTEATCKTDGTKVYTCTRCDDSYTTTYSNPDAHVYNTGATADGVTTYTCLFCDNSYQVISYKDATVATTSAEDLSRVGAIELKNATIALDQSVLENVAGNETTNVSITAETKTADEVYASEEIKAQIGDSPVYDFTLTADDTPVSELGGNVTITVPYTLGEDEDPDSIVVWYLNGYSVESIQASYANGFVTFETNHFSYYTVVRLSRADTCKVYGHTWVTTSTKASTCSTQGYEAYLCRRCGETKTKALPLTDHDYKLVKTVASTSTVRGHKDYECQVCGNTYSETLPLKRETGEGFFENLLMSALRSDMSGNMDMGKDEQGVVYLIHNDGMMCTVTISDDSVTIMDADGEFVMRHYNDYTEYEIYDSDSYGSSMTYSMMVYGMIEEVYYLLPAYLTDTIWGVISDNALDVTRTSDGYVLTLNLDKLAETFRTLLSNTIADDVDILLGEGTYSGLMSFMDFACNSTVNTLLGGLEILYGVDVDAIIEYADSYLADMTGGQMNVETILAQVGDMKVLDVINMAMSSGMMGGGKVKEEPVHVESNESLLLSDGPARGIQDDQPVEEEPAGITYEQIKAMVEQYASMTLNDVLHVFEEIPDTLGADFIYNMAFGGRVKSLGVTMYTAENGQLYELSVDYVSHYDYYEDDEDVEYNMTLNFYETLPEDDLAIIAEKKEEIEGYVYAPAFEINEDNYEFIVKDFIDKFDIGFTYTVEDGQVVLVSDIYQVNEERGMWIYKIYRVEYDVADNDYNYVIVESIPEADWDYDYYYDKYYYDNYNGVAGETSYYYTYDEDYEYFDYAINRYMTVTIRNGGWYDREVYVYDSDPDVVWKYFYREFRIYEETEEDYYYQINSGSSSAYMRWNKATNETSLAYYRTANAGSPVVEEITKEAYLAAGKYDPENDSGNHYANNLETAFGATRTYRYYKITDGDLVTYNYITCYEKDGIELSEYYGGSNIWSTSMASPVDNDYNATYANVEYRRDNIGIYVDTEVYSHYLSDSFYLDYDYADTNKLFENYIDDNSDNTLTCGNVTMKVVSFNEYDTYYAMRYTLTIGGKLVGTFDYHECKNDEDHMESGEYRDDSGCTVYYYEYCTVCGRYYTYTSTEHDWSEFTFEELIPYTQTQYGVTTATRTCKKCGLIGTYYFQTACEHTDTYVDGNMTVCRDCGFSYVTENGKPRIYLELLAEEDDELTFGFRFSYAAIGDNSVDYFYSERRPGSNNASMEHSYYRPMYYSFPGIDQLAQTDIDRHVSYFGWNYYAVAHIAFYNEDNELEFLEEYEQYGNYYQSDYDYSYDMPAPYYRNLISFDMEYLNETLAELNENGNDYFFVVSIVDNYNGEAFNYVMD